MTVYDAIAHAECVLPGHPVPDGQIDPRWQAIIAVGEFILDEPEAVWSLISQWGDTEDEDLRAYSQPACSSTFSNSISTGTLIVSRNAPWPIAHS